MGHSFTLSFLLFPDNSKHKEDITYEDKFHSEKIKLHHDSRESLEGENSQGRGQVPPVLGRW